jgi:hypothetical protein
VADWRDVIMRVTFFALRWHDHAQACGWSALDLYGPHPLASYARLRQSPPP